MVNDVAVAIAIAIAVAVAVAVYVYVYISVGSEKRHCELRQVRGLVPGPKRPQRRPVGFYINFVQKFWGIWDCFQSWSTWVATYL
jgi:hypothetical protein